MTRKGESADATCGETMGPVHETSELPTPNISRMGYNPANFAYWIGTGPWVAGYSVYYTLTPLFYPVVRPL